MQILKKGGGWLNRKIWSYRVTAWFLLILGIGFCIHLYAAHDVKSGYLIMVIVISAVYYYYSRAPSYKKGRTGEELVTKELKKKLDDDYYLINDLDLPDSKGNIDHVVVGPTGIFVIETKNFTGHIVCDGDIWCRRYTNGLIFKKTDDRRIKSISRQAKDNAMAVRKTILQEYGSSPWVQPVVVFTNPACKIEPTNPSTKICRITELDSYIKNQIPIRMPPQQIESIAHYLAKQ
ncbi:MAG: nuclease-related domain-containing protein [Candidatus Thermoplasmatota archaeon]|nr:nuclease-related domain-containing protein [Candidatus Thermoplasmatota archaeon]MDD5778690.1 nuclease-related domain-containing protein [Candidatus Thermoplasmatota archaeon]